MNVLAAAVAIVWFVGWSTVALPAIFGFAACALATRPMQTERTFRARDDKDSGNWSFLLILVPMLYAGTLFGLLGVIGFGGLRIVTAGFLAVLIGSKCTWLGLGSHRRLLAATPWNGEPGDDTLVEGTVRDPTPVTIGTIEHAALGRVTAYDKSIGSNPDIVKWTRFHADGTFLVDAKAGVVEIDPDELVWASTVVERPEVTVTLGSATAVTDSGGNFYSSTPVTSGTAKTPTLSMTASATGDCNSGSCHMAKAGQTLPGAGDPAYGSGNGSIYN